VPDWVRNTSSKHLNDPVSVTVDPRPEDAAPIDHTVYDVANGDKLAALRDLLDHRGDASVIVFGRTKHGVKKLARQLEVAGYPVAALQGNLSQNARDKVMADFRDGAVPILLATNVAARGLDVSHVAQVINIELPESPELLTHRIGRTGRMGRQGQAITLLGAEDGPKWRQLERGLGKRIPRAPWRGAKAALNGSAAPVVTADLPLAPAAPIERQPRPARPAPAERPARQPRRTQVAPTTAVTDDPRLDVKVDDAHQLLNVYGRDPRRPAWVTGGGDPAAKQPTREQPRSRRRTRPEGETSTFQVACDNCGEQAEVRFQPDPTRPVYCDDCFRARGRNRRRPVAA
jgi:CxxC-x17-CxxC domain-containing protein